VRALLEEPLVLSTLGGLVWYLRTVRRETVRPLLRCGVLSHTRFCSSSWTASCWRSSALQWTVRWTRVRPSF
jgi:hypothetical protein